MKTAADIIKLIEGCDEGKTEFTGKDGEKWSAYEKDKTPDQKKRLADFVSYMDSVGKRTDTKDSHGANLKRGAEKFNIPLDYAEYVYPFQD